MSEFEERDWNQLLPELIHLIAKKLPDVLNFIRFRSVCKAWQSSAHLSDPPTQFPWICEYPQEESPHVNDAGCLFEGLKNFYSISSAEIVMINVRAPHLDGNWGDCMATCCHNVPFVRHKDYIDDYSYGHCADLHFYNPLTKKLFAIERVPLGLQEPFIAWTGTNPLCNRSMLLVDDNMMSCNNSKRVGLAFFDPQRKNWIVHKGSFCNVFFCQGMIFTIEANGNTMIWDLSSKMLAHELPPPNNEINTLDDKVFLPRRLQKQRTYIVESSEIILRVSWFYDRLQEIANCSIFHIYKLQFNGGNEKPYWVKLNNIGNQVLFLEGKIAFSMDARPSTGFQKGCIYFLCPYYGKPYVYDVLVGTIERVPVPSSFRWCSWFVPGLC